MTGSSLKKPRPGRSHREKGFVREIGWRNAAWRQIGLAVGFAQTRRRGPDSGVNRFHVTNTLNQCKSVSGLSGIHCQKTWDNILLNKSDTPDFQTDAKSLFWNLTYCLVVKSWSGTRDLSFFYQNIFLELDFLSRMFCFRRIFNTESMFPSLLLHILDSDRAKWFMICKICIAFQRSLHRILFLSLTLHQFADNQHEKYVISNRFVLVCKFWFFCFFAVFFDLRCCSREEPTNCFKLNTTQ